jgi:hypothetical protein
MIRNDGTLFRQAVEEVTKELVSADHRAGFSFVKTPLTYPSGAGVVVRVGDSYPNFLVTDFGSGYEEADLMGSSGVYVRSARAIAETAGIGFDSHAFFVLQVPRTQLPGAIVTVANCSREAVSVAAFRMSERRFAENTELLYRRLVTVFPRRTVVKDAEIMGQSTTRWHVATLVSDGPRPTIFEPVSNHHASIFAAATKFNDIAKAEDPPTRVAVVRNKIEFKTYLAVLSQEAHVIESEAPDATLVRLAA